MYIAMCNISLKEPVDSGIISIKTLQRCAGCTDSWPDLLNLETTLHN